MPARFSGKLLHFLFGHLEQETFGERLLWLDRPAGVFQILWKHGNSPTTTPDEDSAVFAMWHNKKNRQRPYCLAEAKQRLRVALLKMQLDRLKCWRDAFPRKHFQFWRFPPEDLAYLREKADKDQYEHWKRTFLHCRNTTVPENKKAWWREVPTPQQLPVVIMQEPMSEPESGTESELELDAKPAIEGKREPQVEPELQPEKEPKPQPKTVQRTEVAIGQRKPSPANRDSSPPPSQQGRLRPRSRKCC